MLLTNVKFCFYFILGGFLFCLFWFLNIIPGYFYLYCFIEIILSLWNLVVKIRDQSYDIIKHANIWSTLVRFHINYKFQVCIRTFLIVDYAKMSDILFLNRGFRLSVMVKSCNQVAFITIFLIKFTINDLRFAI